MFQKKTYKILNIQKQKDKIYIYILKYLREIRYNENFEETNNIYELTQDTDNHKRTVG